MRVIERALCSFLALLTFTMSGPWQAWAQQRTSTIVGSVVNNQKSPVPGVKILAKDSSGKLILGEAVTDAEGYYILKNLSIGQYQLTLDPLKSPYQGETVVTSFGPEGLTVDWIVSKSAKAIAAATTGIASGGPLAFGETLAMAAATPGTGGSGGFFGPATSTAIGAFVISSFTGSLIWAAVTAGKAHSPSN